MADGRVFAAFWREGLLAYDAVQASTGPGWRWTGRWARRRSAGGKTGPNPTDRGKRGVKRSMLTDGRGVPLGAVIDGANRNDHKLMRQTIEAIPVKRPKPTRRQPQHLCLDKGFDYEEPRALAAEFGFTLHLRTRGEEPGPSVMPEPKRGAGWWSEHTPGSTASAAS